jgi:hypothetical protein
VRQALNQQCLWSRNTFQVSSAGEKTAQCASRACRLRRSERDSFLLQSEPCRSPACRLQPFLIKAIALFSFNSAAARPQGHRTASGPDLIT